MGWSERGYSITPSDCGTKDLCQVYHNTKKTVAFRGTLEECAIVLDKLKNNKK
jgi:hypothetical protein